MKTFKTELLSGMFWTIIEMVINRGFQFFIKLILARLLFPEDYGLIGMAVVFTSVISVFNEMGIGAALVQKREKELNDDHYNTAFWTGILWSILIYLIIYFVVAPFGAEFYNEPELINIIPMLSLTVLAAPINIVHKAQLVRNLNFKKLSFISNTSTISSGTLALILAYMGAGVWSLVFNSIIGALVAMPQLFLASRWLPEFSFSKRAFKDIFGFGVYTTGTKLFGKINGQIDYLVVGKFLGSASLGIYTLAFLLTSTVRAQILRVVEQVLYPLFSQLQDEPSKLKIYYLKILNANILIIYPLMFGLILFAKNIVPLFFGSKWLDSIPIVQILSLGVITSTLMTSSSILIRASGVPKLELKLATASSLLFFLPLITLGAYYYNVIGAAWGYVIATTLNTILKFVILIRTFNFSIRMFYENLNMVILITILSFGIGYICDYFEVFWIINLLIYVLSFLILTWTFMKNEILNGITSIKETRKSKSVKNKS